MSAVASAATEAIRRFADLRRADVPFAGGKGANLGELTAAGVPVPDGFVVGAPAYAAFCATGDLRARLADALADVDPADTAGLERSAAAARELVAAAPVPEGLRAAIAAAYAELCGDEGDVPVAVRSSATAEDTESASFAGMNETYLNVRGADAVVDAVRRCWTSLFGARTVFYRAQRGFPQAEMDIAVVVQRQVASTRAGVMFTIDPASGRADRLVIEGAFGLGESVVSGQVSPDRYIVDKQTLATVASEVRRKELAIEPLGDGGTRTRELSGEEALAPVLDAAEVRTLAELGLAIERHYGAPQDTEWAFDPDGRPWMLQSRPVTSAGGHPTVEQAAGGEPLVRGLGAAPGSGSGVARIVRSLQDAARLGDGDVLVTHMTAPDWVPLMRRAAAVVTDSGGMTCHAAIVSRELGVPCLVGTGDATSKLRDGELVTVDATHGVVVAGRAEPRIAPATPAPVVVGAAATTATKLLVNMSEPSQVARAAALPVDGVGLLRAELMVLEALGGEHPRALIEQGRGAELSERLAAALETFAA
ncbi:MAG TPA: PEP/pyruvate-binding domain-containing protein, partial [Solirubrobacteraceae bacterium]|nr:PEP/pyruvate-binding domain-containing protein [Solirubrobacteraceae bacterium]